MRRMRRMRRIMRVDEMSLLPRTRTAILRHTRMFRKPRHIRALECALLAALSRPVTDDDETGGGALVRLLRLETRIKTPSSIWYKLMRKGLLPCVSLDILEYSSSELQRIDEEIASIISDDFIDLIFTGEVLDIVGTRVFVENEADCYAARDQLVAARPPFRFVGERSKDYIRCDGSNNGYQSLHETLFFPLSSGIELPAEVQIRTPAMHRIAETGSAAHAEYKRVRFAKGRCGSYYCS